MPKKNSKSVTPQPGSDTTKAPQEFGKPRTGFDDEGALGRGLAQTNLGAAGPVRPPNPRPGIH